MDYQNRVGSKFGGGGVAGASETNAARRERLRAFAAETIDLAKDPYFFRNHLGSYECRLCLTAHANDGSYLAHTQGKKHQQNLGRRAARDAQLARDGPGAANDMRLGAAVPIRHNVLRIGRPGYKIQKIRSAETGRLGLFIQVSLPQIEAGFRPRYRFMSAFEQKVEQPDRHWQYLIIAADPYDIIAFKIEAREIDRSKNTTTGMWELWDAPTYSIQFFWADEVQTFKGVPGLN
jgi:splicing factor 3A subunit 2